VYVIDEVHMFSNAAFNALLKTLEEPPPHAIFVLATTESHKIPATVLSRCQRFDFRRVPVTDIVDRLERLAEQEHIVAEREALILIARQATGSMRDAESLLDQLASYDGGGITVAQVRAALGTGASETVLQVAEALAGGDVARGLGAINAAVDEGADPRQFARQMVEHLRALLMLRLDSGTVLLHVSEDMRPRLAEQAAAFSPRALAGQCACSTRRRPRPGGDGSLSCRWRWPSSRLRYRLNRQALPPLHSRPRVPLARRRPPITRRPRRSPRRCPHRPGLGLRLPIPRPRLPLGLRQRPENPSRFTAVTLPVARRLATAR
jgi:hypothetical protein